MSVALSTEARLDALLARLAPRLAPGDRALARERLRVLVGELPTAPLAELAGHALPALEAWLHPASVHADAHALDSPPAVLAPERALALARARAASVPPELSDGAPIRWAREETGLEGPLGLWRARRERGPVPGELLFAYLHVPFCRTRCAFCQFESVVEGRGGARADYVRSVRAEASTLGAELGALDADAITIGGGTPSELEPPLLGAVLDALLSLVTPRAGAYFSVELNPDSATAERVALIADAGVHRVSMGVQSFEPATLHAVARGYQSAAMVEEAVACVRARSGLSLGLDLLAPLPHETLASFTAGVERALALAPDELVLYRYQPVLRGAERTIAPGALPYEDALAVFVARAREVGYAVVEHTGSSCVARAPHTVVPDVRYVQHPREPTSILGLGPHAESHVFGHGRYVALDGTRYRVARTDLAIERAQLVGRRLGASMPIEEAVLERATGRTLATSRPEAVGFFAARGELVRAGSQLTPSWPTREDAQHASWAFLDPRTLRDLRASDDRERSSLLARLTRAGLWGETSDPTGPAAELTERMHEVELRALLRADGRGRGAVVGRVGIDDLLLDESDAGLRALLESAGLPAAGALARLVFDRVLGDAPELTLSGPDATLSFDVSARAPHALEWLCASLGLDATAHGGPATLTALRITRSLAAARAVSLVRTLASSSAPATQLARWLDPGGTMSPTALRISHVLVPATGAEALEIRTDDRAARAVLRGLLEARAHALADEVARCAAALDADLDGLIVPLDARARPRPDAIEATLGRASHARRRLPTAG